MLAAASPVPVPTPSADELIDQARAGSETAFAALVREHQAMVFGLAYHFLQSWSQAEELLGELWRDFFQVERLALSDSFLQLGGDSLRAAEDGRTRLVSTRGLGHGRILASPPVFAAFDQLTQPRSEA